jgi:hypothetical protein
MDFAQRTHNYTEVYSTHIYTVHSFASFVVCLGAWSYRILWTLQTSLLGIFPSFFLGRARITGRKHYNFHFYTDNIYKPGTFIICCYNVTPHTCKAWQVEKKSGDMLSNIQSSGVHTATCLNLSLLMMSIYKGFPSISLPKNSLTSVRLLSSQEGLWSIFWSFYHISVYATILLNPLSSSYGVLSSSYYHHSHNIFWAIVFLKRFARLVHSWVCCHELGHPVFTSLGFATIFFLESKVVSLASNPQPGGLGPCIYVPQWQDCPVKPPGTGFRFRRLLRLAVLRWWESSPPAHGKVRHIN